MTNHKFIPLLVIVIITIMGERKMSLEKKHRMTRQRMVILDELRKVSSHPTADEVYKMLRKILPRISLGTVYRNLEILSVMGLISKLEIDANQKRFDGNINKHYHICCIDCNRVYDINPETVKIDYSPDNPEGCKIIDYSFHFIGLCEECIKKNSIHKTSSSDRFKLKIRKSVSNNYR